jgi:hypothetical protein
MDSTYFIPTSKSNQLKDEATSLVSRTNYNCVPLFSYWSFWQLQQCIVECSNYQSVSKEYGFSWSYLLAHLPCTIQRSWHLTQGTKKPTVLAKPQGTQSVNEQNRIEQSWKDKQVSDTQIRHAFLFSLSSRSIDDTDTNPAGLIQSKQFVLNLPTHRLNVYESWKEDAKNTSNPFSFERDYIVEQEGFENWSWLRPSLQVSSSSIGGNRGLPYDFQIRQQTLTNTFNTSAFVEHGSNDELSNEYTSSLQSKQRVKWWYGQTIPIKQSDKEGNSLTFTRGHSSVIGTDKAKRHAVQSTQKKGFSYSVPVSRLLWHHGWFKSQAQSKQSIQHGHIGCLSIKITSAADSSSGYSQYDLLNTGNLAATKPSYLPRQGDIFFHRIVKGKERTQPTLNNIKKRSVNYPHAKLESWGSLYRPISNACLIQGSSYRLPSWFHFDRIHPNTSDVSTSSSIKSTRPQVYTVRSPILVSSLSNNLMESFLQLENISSTSSCVSYLQGSSTYNDTMSKKQSVKEISSLIHQSIHSNSYNWRNLPLASIFWSNSLRSYSNHKGTQGTQYIDGFLDTHYKYPYCLFKYR